MEDKASAKVLGQTERSLGCWTRKDQGGQSLAVEGEVRWDVRYSFGGKSDLTLPIPQVPLLPYPSLRCHLLERKRLNLTLSQKPCITTQLHIDTILPTHREHLQASAPLPHHTHQRKNPRPCDLPPSPRRLPLRIPTPVIPPKGTCSGEEWDSTTLGGPRVGLRELSEGDFPGGPVAKTLRFQCRGPEFNAWSGNQDPASCNEDQSSCMPQLRPKTA